MVDVKFVIYIVIGLISIGGAIVGFFQMQTRQNMKIEALEKEVAELRRKQTEATTHQIQTEKTIIEINTKLDHILQAIAEIKGKTNV